jgi:hypothetical protein
MRAIASSLAPILALFISLPTAAAWASNTPPGFDSAKWKQLVEKIQTQGAHYQGPDENSWFTLSRVNPADITVSHEADYISTIGVESSREYVAFEIDAIFETWTLRPDHNWDLEQWMYRVEMNGDLAGVWHSRLVETTDNVVLDMQELPTDAPTSASELKRWGEKLETWYSGLSISSTLNVRP